MTNEDDDDDADGRAEMSGTIVEWSGRVGHVHTDCEKRLRIGRDQLAALGFRGPIGDGDRVHFYATKHIKVMYHIDRIRLIIPSASSQPQTASQSPQRRDLRPGDSMKIFTGDIETFDAEKGYGFVRASCGKRLLLHITCLRASGYRTLPLGVNLTCKALRRPRGWQVIRVLSTQ